MATQGVRPNVATELSIHYFDNHDQRLMQALVTVGALVALADGRVEVCERDELVDFVDRQGFISTISRRCIAQTFDDRVQQLEDRHGAKVIVETFRPLAGLSLASVVIRTAERVAAADRKIHPGELRALKLIRSIMMALPSNGPPPRLRML